MHLGIYKIDDKTPLEFLMQLYSVKYTYYNHIVYNIDYRALEVYITMQNDILQNDLSHDRFHDELTQRKVKKKMF